jgi:hypothetical protein
MGGGGRAMRLSGPCLLLYGLSTAYGAARADWTGEGQVVGEVIDSRWVGEALVFRLAIARQDIEGGPGLASPGTFSYRHPGPTALPRGVSVRVHARGSDELGITVVRLEPANGPIGAAGVLWGIALLALGGVLARAVLRTTRGSAPTTDG